MRPLALKVVATGDPICSARAMIGIDTPACLFEYGRPVDSKGDGHAAPSRGDKRGGNGRVSVRTDLIEPLAVTHTGDHP